MRADIAPGGTFPDYELTDHTKTRHKLSELQGNGPRVQKDLASRSTQTPTTIP